MPHLHALRLRAAHAAAGAAAAAALLATAVAPPAAQAGIYTQVVCNLNSQPAPIDGFTPLSTSGTALSHCDTGGALIASISSAAAVTAGTGSTWIYTAPPGSTIAGGALNIALQAPAGLAYVSTPLPTFDTADVLAACASGTACGGAIGGRLTQTLPITHAGGTHIYLVADCLGACTAGSGGGAFFAEADVASGAIELLNTATPAGSAFAGGLLAAGPVASVQSLTFTATDPGGPGVLRVDATIDGRSVYSATPDTNGGRCAIVGVDGGMHPEYLYGQPCATSVPVTIPPVNTAALADGAHTLSVSVTDAAANTSVVLTRALTTANAAAAPTPPPAPAGNPCTSGVPQKPALYFRVRGIGNGRVRFTGKLSSPFGCPLGTPSARPLVIIEVHNGRHWQPVATARVSPAGGFRATYHGGRGGSVGGAFTFRLRLPATPEFLSATSRTRRARVR